MKLKLWYVLLIAIIIFSGCARSTFRTFYKPIIFDEQRKQLSVEYLKTRHGIIQQNAIIKPVMVVLHWTAIPTLERTFDAFNTPTLPDARKAISSAGTLKSQVSI